MGFSIVVHDVCGSAGSDVTIAPEAQGILSLLGRVKALITKHGGDLLNEFASSLSADYLTKADAVQVLPSYSGAFTQLCRWLLDFQAPGFHNISVALADGLSVVWENFASRRDLCLNFEADLSVETFVAASSALHKVTTSPRLLELGQYTGSLVT